MSVTFPQLLRFANLALRLLRIIVGIVFFASGWSHVTHPAARSHSLGLNKSFTIFLGAVEVAGALAIISGVLAQVAALGLILVMLGAIHRKIFVWHTGFWGEKNSGWHYDLLFAVMCLVIGCVGPGHHVLLN